MSVREKLKQRRSTTVYVPEWEETVCVRPLSARERMELTEEKDNLLVMALMCVRAVTDQDGNRLLGDEDVPDLLADGVVLERLIPEVVRLNSVTKESVDDAKKN